MSKKEEIVIRPIPQDNQLEDKRFKKLKKKFKNIPPPPLRMIINGSSASGKSSFLYTLLKKYYNKYFDEILVFSGTMDSNGAWSKLRTHDNGTPEIFNEFDGQVLSEYIEQVEEDFTQAIDEGEEPQRIAIIFDDMITDGISERMRMNVIDKLFVQGRHFWVSTFIITQLYKALNRNQRCLNCSHVVVYPTNLNDLKMIAEDHAPNGYDTKMFLELMNHTLNKKPYNYMVIDYTQPQSKRYKDTFNKVLNISKLKKTGGYEPEDDE